MVLNHHEILGKLNEKLLVAFLESILLALGLRQLIHEPRHVDKRIVASPLSRAHDTARTAAGVLGLEITLDAGLMECHLGDHQGDPHGPWLEDYFEGRYAPPNGERFEEFCARTWAAMRRAVALGPNTLIVAHGGLWISARRYVTVDPDLPRMPNALPLHIVPERDVWRHRIIGNGEWNDALTV